MFTFAVTDGSESAEDAVTITVRDVPIAVSSAVYGSGTITITFNQDFDGAPDYSRLHVRGAGSNSGGITLSDVSERSHSGRTVTATLSEGQQGEYGSLQGPQLDVDAGAVTDRDGVGIAATPDIPIRSASSGTRSTALPPAIDLGSLESRGVDIPKEIAEAASGRGSGPIPPVRPDQTFEYPLEINGLGYLLDGQVNTLVPHAVAAGQPATIRVTLHDTRPIAYFAIYLNLPDDEISHLDGDSQIIWNYGQTYVVDRGGLMQNATITMSEDPGDPARKAFTVTVTLSEGMGESNMVIRTWNSAGKLATVQVFDAITVRAPEPEPVEVDPEPVEVLVVTDPEPAAAGDDDDPAVRDLLVIRMWSGFEPESMTDADLLESLGLDYPGADIPSWVMTELGVLAVQGGVTAEQFRVALEYVLGNA